MNLWIQILFGTLAVAPPLLVLTVLIACILRARRKSRVPVKDKLLRAPGETLQRRLNRFDDNTIPYLFGLLAFGFLCFALFALFLKWRLKSPHLLVEAVCFWLAI